MKALVCEMCGSNDIVKQDGYFVCQVCGTKYSVEEARKMMIEGSVDVSGSTIKIDSSDDLAKLYQAARNARETSDTESALKHYENISAKDPNSWEALFYLVVLKTKSIKNGQIASSSISVQNCLPKVFQLIKDTISDEQEKKKAVKEVIEQCYAAASWLTNASENYFNNLTKGNGVMALTGVVGAISSANSTANALSEHRDRCCSSANIMCLCGNYIEQYFDMNDKDYNFYAVWSWKKMIEFNSKFNSNYSINLFTDESLVRFTTKINKSDPSYPIFVSKKGTKKDRKFSYKQLLLIVGIICICFFILTIIILKIRNPSDTLFKFALLDSLPLLVPSLVSGVVTLVISFLIKPAKPNANTEESHNENNNS